MHREAPGLGQVGHRLPQAPQPVELQRERELERGVHRAAALGRPEEMDGTRLVALRFAGLCRPEVVGLVPRLQVGRGEALPVRLAVSPRKGEKAHNGLERILVRRVLRENDPELPLGPGVVPRCAQQGRPGQGSIYIST